MSLQVILFAAAAVSRASSSLVTAIDGYIFAYPLVLVNVTLNSHVGASNTFTHARDFPAAADRTVVRPNLDTLYSTAWLDLSDGPIVLRVPEMGEHFFLFQMMDAWTNTFASPSTRLNGSSGGAWAVCEAGWSGTLPPGVVRIDAPTRHVWIVGRTQVRGEGDLPAVRALQDKYTLLPLVGSDGGEGGPRRKYPFIEEGALLPPPPAIVAAMDAQTFFTLFAAIMASGDAPSPSDPIMVSKLKTLGVIVGTPLEWSRDLSAAQRVTLDAAVPLAKELLATSAAAANDDIAGWDYPPPSIGGPYGTQYSIRAGVAFVGLGANPPKDAMYASCKMVGSGAGENGTLRGNGSYVLTFPAAAAARSGELPPVNADAFWSLTVYTTKGYLIANAWNKSSISSWQNLTYNSDGSLSVLFSPTPPPVAANMYANWIPSGGASVAEFSVTSRAYWPLPQLLNGSWTWPAITENSSVWCKQIGEACVSDCCSGLRCDVAPDCGGPAPPPSAPLCQIIPPPPPPGCKQIGEACVSDTDCCPDPVCHEISCEGKQCQRLMPPTASPTILTLD